MWRISMQGSTGKAVLAAVIAAVATLALAPAAHARQVVTHSSLSSFDGATSTAGPFGDKITSVAVDEVTGNVYALTRKLVIDKFDAGGNPLPFSAPSLEGASSLNITTNQEGFARDLHIYVDNSSASTQGRIYVVWGEFPHELIYAFKSDGSPVGGNYPLHVSALTSMSIDPSSGDYWTGVANRFLVSSHRYTSDGIDSGDKLPLSPQEGVEFAYGGGTTGVDSDGNVYLGQSESGLTGIEKYDVTKAFQYTLPASPTFVIDPVTNDLYTLNTSNIAQYSESGERIWQFGGPFADATAVAVNGVNGKVYVSRAGSSKRVDVYGPGATVTVPNVTTGSASEFHATSVKLSGTLNPDGQETTSCRFEWSTDMSFASSTPCAEGNMLAGSSGLPVSATPTGLKQGQKYHYRLAAANSNGSVAGIEGIFIPSAEPGIHDQWVTNVHSDSVELHTQLAPEGAPTMFRFQYGPEDCAISTCNESSIGNAGSGPSSQSLSQVLTGLQPGITYHYRVVATNQSGASFGSDRSFSTFPYTAVLSDPCPNAHVRQQVSAALLRDCRAYELVSAANTGGYNVESDLIVGQHPFGGYPNAQEKVLYGAHSGAIPGPWYPTNKGVDPYISTRGKEGWGTEYVGIPADNPYANAPFASELDEATSTLSMLAFGPAGICSPCFEDGSTGIPLREPDGSMVQAMKGPEEPGPSATSDGLIKKRFSSDGDHLIFGSTSKFAAGGNDETGDVSIYDRNLKTGETQVLSNDPSGNPLPCLQGPGECHSPTNPAGIAELDVSKDGSHVVLGQLIGTDAKGNRYFHLYMHLGNTPETIDLTPGTTSGVQYAGMTEKGTIVYFSTKDPLTTAADQDTDSSVDVFRADVSPTGATLTRVSLGEGGTGNTDSCEPAGNAVNQHWNTVTDLGDCSAVAVGGAGGVAAEQGGMYFLSPEKLDASDPQHEPTQGAPNLYLATPGSTPLFVTTLESNLTGPSPLPTEHSFVGSFSAAGFGNPQSMAVDQSTGNIYVLDAKSEGEGTVRRFKPDGTPDNFTAGPAIGTNVITGFTFGTQGVAQVAVDNSGGVTDGDIYITSNSQSDKTVKIFARSGASLGQLTGSGTAAGKFGGASGATAIPTGVAVNRNGVLFVSGGNSGNIYRYVPSGNPVAETDYQSVLNWGTQIPGALAVDSSGNVYVERLNGTAIVQAGLTKFTAAQFGQAGPQTGTVVDTASKAAYVDPRDDYLYTNDRSTIREYLPSGILHSTFGAGQIGTNSRGVAVQGSSDGASTRIYVANTAAKEVRTYASSLTAAATGLVNNPLVIDSVNATETRKVAEFQVTSDGSYAAFSTTISLYGFDNARFSEVYRYDAQSGELTCASCNPTGARASGSSGLASNGLSLLSDGRMFFNSNDALAPRDLNQRQDVYQWSASSGPQLISTGESPFDSSLLGADSSGENVYFFSRDTLVPQDKNGTLVKIYDARENGGFPFLPAAVPCKASDECHGPGSEPAGPLPVNTASGSGGNTASSPIKRCRKGLKRRGRRCISEHRHGKKRHRPAAAIRTIKETR